jgi:putative FmdB family regulatory protein
MPLYEYWCHHCANKVTLYIHVNTALKPICPKCSSKKLERLLSTFAVHKTDKSIYEGILNDSQLTKGMLDNNPKALAEWNKRMSRGEKTAPEYEETIQKMEKGQMPDSLKE